MRKFTTFLIIAVLAFLPISVFAESSVSLAPSDMATLVDLDMSSSNLTTSYANASSTLASSLLGKSNVCLFNTSATLIFGSVGASSCSVSSVNNFVVPANNGGICLERVRIKGAICAKSSSGTISSGHLYLSYW